MAHRCPSGGTTEATLRGPAAVASTALRNIALHLGTPGPTINAALTRGIEAGHRRLGVEPSDWRTTILGTTFEIRPPSVHEDTAGNSLHVVLIVCSLVALLLSRAVRQRPLLLYAAALGAAFLLFSLGLRWAPFHSRLQLPLFILAAPLVGTVLGTAHRVGRIMIVVLLVASLPWLALNSARPLVGSGSIFRSDRIAQYFANAPWLHDPYRRAVELVRARGCSEIGLVVRSSDWEYPLWVLLGGLDGQARLVHVADGIDTPLEPPRTGDAAPTLCAIVTTTGPRAGPLSQQGIVYRPALAAAPLSVLLPGPPGGAPAPVSGAAAGRAIARVVAGEEPAGGEPLDLYVGALTPDGRVAWMFFQPSSVAGRRVDLPGGPVPMQAVPPGATLDRPDFFEFSFPSFAQLGTYQAFAVLARPGAFTGIEWRQGRSRPST